MSKKNKQYYTIVSNQTTGVATIEIDGEISIWDDNNSKNLSNRLAILNGDDAITSIVIEINSGGGDVYEGVAIVNAMHASKKPITTFVKGIAASMAAVIAVSGDVVKMSKYSQLMFHKPLAGNWGRSEELRETADLIDRAEANLIDIVADKRGISSEEVSSKYFTGKDVWLSAAEAQEQLLVDEIVSFKKALVTPENYTKFAIAARVDFFSEQFKTNMLDSTPVSKNHTQKPDMNKPVISATLLSALALNASATVADVEISVSAVLAENKDLKAKIEAGNKLRVDALINTAKSEGKILASEVEEYTELANANYEIAVKTIAKLSGKPNPLAGLEQEARTESEIPKGRENWTLLDYGKHDVIALKAIKENDPDMYAEICSRKGRTV